jgi:hypothetical protein
MREFNIKINNGSSTSTFSIYWDSISPSNYATLSGTTNNATGLTFLQMTTGQGIVVDVPDNTTSIILNSSQTTFCQGIGNSNTVYTYNLSSTPSQTGEYFVYKNCSTGTYVYQNELVPGVSVGQILGTDDGSYNQECEPQYGSQGEYLSDYCYDTDYVPFKECWEFIGQFETVEGTNMSGASYRNLTDIFIDNIYISCSNCLASI